MNTQTETDYNFKGRIMVQNFGQLSIVDEKPTRVHHRPIISTSPFTAMNIEEFIAMQEPKRILRLTLKKYWYDFMKTGVKDLEFRKKSTWIEARLLERNYDFVEFSNGYKKNSPKFTVQYQGYSIADHDHYVRFNDSERIEVEKGDYIIKLGRIISISE